VIALSLAFLCCFQGADADAPLTRAREETRRADESVAQAEAKLAGVYQDFERWIARSKGISLEKPLVAAAQEAIAATRAEIAASRLDGGSKAKVVADLRQRLMEATRAILPAGIRPAVAQHLADQLAAIPNQTNPNDAAAKAAADLCGKWLDPNIPAHELWNRDLFKEVPAARDFAAARAAQAAANDKITRIEHPERFVSAYGNTPDGMIFVMAGSYTLGPNEGYDIDGDKRKSPFQVNLKQFYLDKTEVTNRQYHDFLRSLNKADALLHSPQGWEKSAKEGYAIYPTGMDNYPVTGVSYEDAAAFAGWVKKRLPTEDEWEAAARGQRGFRYPWGNDYEAKRANDANADPGDVVAVGSFPGDVSPFGALDMAGNVMEWVGTLEGGKPAPPKLEANSGVVIRGGCYDREAKKCSALFRWVWPGKTTKVRNLGFRCAKDAF
jgi:formylglycine-generating enzyme required for sulfatase activity